MPTQKLYNIFPAHNKPGQLSFLRLLPLVLADVRNCSAAHAVLLKCSLPDEPTGPRLTVERGGCRSEKDRMELFSPMGVLCSGYSASDVALPSWWAEEAGAGASEAVKGVLDLTLDVEGEQGGRGGGWSRSIPLAICCLGQSKGG